MTKKVTIGLCMIVKNERDVIERCLRNVAPLIDVITICDTGSTDGTQEIIRATASDLGMPAVVHDRPWKNFGHNRSEAMSLARDAADYSFVIDADEILRIQPGFGKDQMGQLTDRAYSYAMVHGALMYQRTAIFSNKLPWRYSGVLHEYPEAPGHGSINATPLPQLSVFYTSEGARSKNPEKYKDDAHVFIEALKEEPLNGRYWYYLGQSWRDYGDKLRAIEAYLHRSHMGGWDEESWSAMYQAAKLMDFSNAYPEGAVVQAYLRAYQFRPTRAEPLVYLAAYYRYRKQNHLALMFVRQACEIKLPDDRLFVERDCYGWRRLDEMGLALSGLGRKTEAHEIWSRLIVDGGTPDAQKARIKTNLANLAG